jgi:hypothetical protein
LTIENKMLRHDCIKYVSTNLYILVYKFLKEKPSLSYRRDEETSVIFACVQKIIVERRVRQYI